MGKTYDFVEEIDNGISVIRRLLQDANISANELKIQSGITFACSTGSTFILYFSKGKTSKIYFEKEDKEVLSLMDKLSVKKEETGCSKVPVYANYSISESNQDLVQLKLEESFSIIKKDIKKNTIKYIFDITDRADKITVTQFLSGKLLLQGMDSAFVTKIREIINSVEPLSNKEEALT